MRKTIRVWLWWKDTMRNEWISKCFRKFSKMFGRRFFDLWPFWAVFSPRDLKHRPPDTFFHRFGPIFIQIRWLKPYFMIFFRFQIWVWDIHFSRYRFGSHGNYDLWSSSLDRDPQGAALEAQGGGGTGTHAHSELKESKDMLNNLEGY